LGTVVDLATGHEEVNRHPQFVGLQMDLRRQTSSGKPQSLERWGNVVPKTRSEFWAAKRKYTVDRDIRNTEKLQSEGWKVITVWSAIHARPSSFRLLSRKYDFGNLAGAKGAFGSPFGERSKRYHRWCGRGDLNPHDRLGSADFHTTSAFAAPLNWFVVWTIPSPSLLTEV
jgi:hypothetical protein